LITGGCENPRNYEGSGSEKHPAISGNKLYLIVFVADVGYRKLGNDMKL